jgi:peptidoglycan/xylan/chitin deacetylase (PgdA/CDA1 family)
MRKHGSIPIVIVILILAAGGVELASMQKPAPSPLPATSPTDSPSPAALPSSTPAPTPTRPHTPTPTRPYAPTPTPPPTLTPTPTNTPTPHPDIALHQPNLQGDVLVLAYHRIARPEDRWTRTPENLRADLEYLVTHGYYPVNLIDLATGDLDHVPRGRRPIVLTFDDSTAGHFRYLEDGAIDPDCAVGILLALHEKYGDDWPLRATFFVLLLDAEKPGAPLFRQPEFAVQKVRALVDWGFEVGSHTITHPTLSEVSDEQVKWELAVSKSRIEALIPGYTVRSLALPNGSYPVDRSLVVEGYSESTQLSYRYEAVARLGAQPCPSPFSPDFDPYSIPRVQAIQSELDYRLSYYEKYPEKYYVSAGSGGIGGES